MVRRPTVAFIIERHVGLDTYGDSIRRAVTGDQRIEAVWRPITYEAKPGRLANRLPPALRGVVSGRAEVRRALGVRCSARCFMSQQAAVLAGRRGRRRPFVILMDDTPALLEPDRGDDRRSVSGWLKHRVNVKVLRRAHRIFAMSPWVARSVVEDYGVDERRVEVLAPGVDLRRWRPGRPRRDDGPVRVLFVEADVSEALHADVLDAFATLPPRTAELHLVTTAAVPAAPGVVVHSDLEPNDDALLRLYQSADLVVEPSRHEVFSQSIVCALAVGVPAVVSDHAASPWIVEDGASGLVVDRRSRQLTPRLTQLVYSAERRRRMGDAARRRAEALFDADVNGARLVTVLLTLAEAPRLGRQRLMRRR